MPEIIVKPSEFIQKEAGLLLSENFFVVPYNQRPYMWEKDKWEELWEDLKDINKERLQDSRDPYRIFHFLGPMFFIKIDDKLEIFDGQQRLVTLTIMLQVIWDLLDELNQRGRYSDEGIRTMTLIRPKIAIEDESGVQHKIKIDSDGERAYEWLLKTNLTPLDKLDAPRVRWDKDPEKQLVNCYKFFFNQFTSFFLKSMDVQFNSQNMLDQAVATEGFVTYLKRMSHNIIEGFYVLISDVPDKSIGYEMFETLNQRGEKLLTIDLFKNLLFTKFQRVIEDDAINDFWKEFRSIAPEKDLGYFLRHFWISKHDFVRDNKLFRDIKNYFDRELELDRSTFEELCQTLLYESKIYFALLNHQENLWQNNLDISETLGELNYLGFTQQLPLFLSAYVHLFQTDIDKFKLLIKTYLTFVIRRNIFMRKSPSEFEEEHSLWARQIRQDPSKIDNIISELKGEIGRAYPIESQIERGFELRNKHAKYILWKINDSITPTSLMKCWRNDPTLEHIIPKNPETWWKDLLRQKDIRHEDFLNRLGNLTLLSNEENNDLGNIDYPTKKQKYIETQLPLNLRTFDNLNDFGEEEIKKREEILSDLISEKELWQ